MRITERTLQRRFDSSRLGCHCGVTVKWVRDMNNKYYLLIIRLIRDEIDGNCQFDKHCILLNTKFDNFF